MPTTVRRQRKDRIGSVKTDPLYTSDEFRMYCFKVVPCSRHYTHDWTECPFAHPGEKATRRDPRLYSYVGIECPHVKGESSRCPRGESCPFAHNVFECWLHPSRYRTQMCNEPATCRRKICFFAHTTQEIREPTKDAQNTKCLPQEPRRVASTVPEKKLSPRSNVKASQTRDCLTSQAAAIRERASFDVPSRKSLVQDFPQRPSLDSRVSQLGIQTNLSPASLSPSLSPQQQQQNQLLSLLASLQEQQKQNQIQQQMQAKSNSFDLTTAIAQLVLEARQQQVPVYSGTPSMPNTIQADQLNELLSIYSQQQNLNNPAAALLQRQPPPPAHSALPPPHPSSVHTCLPNASDAILLHHLQTLQQYQQLPQAQNLQGLSAAGLRASMDSTQSNSSGGIPARISYDGVSSAASSVLQQQGYNYLNNLGSVAPSFFPGVGGSDNATEYMLQGQANRSSTDSSARESFGCISADTALYDTSHKMSASMEHMAGASGHLPVMDDFIGLNQGSDSFVKTNATNPTVSAAESD